MYFLVGGNSSLLARGRERGKSWKSRSLHTHTKRRTVENEIVYTGATGCSKVLQCHDEIVGT